MDQAPTVSEKMAALQAALARLIAHITEESLRSLDSEDNSVLTTELFFEGGYIPPDDVIQLEDLEAPPAKLDDLKADVQDPLEEVNLGSEDRPKPIYVSQRLPEVVKNAYINLLHENKDCFAWECNSEELAPYYMAARQLLDEFDDASLLHVPRRFNQEANELAQIATGIKIPQGWYKRTITIQKRSLPSFKRRSASMEIFTTDLGGQEEDWRTEIITFLKHPNLSSTKKIRERAVHYVLIEDELYKKSLEDDLLLKCVGPQDSLKLPQPKNLLLGFSLVFDFLMGDGFPQLQVGYSRWKVEVAEEDDGMASHDHANTISLNNSMQVYEIGFFINSTKIDSTEGF
ncbi:hypothetical protein Vadar_016463 [Vaccinium darrowii]|uniref:Uncharacterized protein n=1 Tax=Vaccinium darrowii TaxID=229202 RepID=A0ACB7Z4Q1_9ERIC|nr:hypothetical protein Vadar_016463 [Vaccinium darrowii]